MALGSLDNHKEKKDVGQKGKYALLACLHCDEIHSLTVMFYTN
jgi:hypothetical protein